MCVGLLITVGLAPTDINECTSGVHNCGKGEICVNEIGDYRCVDDDCPQGYVHSYETNLCEGRYIGPSNIGFYLGINAPNAPELDLGSF